MGGYSRRQIEELETDLFDRQAGICIEGAPCGGLSGAEHQAAQGCHHRPVIGTEAWLWNSQFDPRLGASFGGHGAKPGIGCDSPCDDK